MKYTILLKQLFTGLLMVIFFGAPYAGCKKDAPKSTQLYSTAGFGFFCSGTACTITAPSTKYFAPKKAILDIVVTTSSYYDPPASIEFMTDTGLVMLHNKNFFNYWDTSIHVSQGTQVTITACGPKKMNIWYKVVALDAAFETLDSGIVACP